MFFADATNASLAVLLPRMAISLVIVIVCMWAAARWLQRRGGNFSIGTRSTRGSKHAQYVDVISRHPLGKHQQLAIVRIGHQMLAVGVTETNISLIAELDSAEETSDLNNCNRVDLTRHTASPRTGIPAKTQSSWKELLAQVQERTVRHTTRS